jgi:RND superfamily putative drug exporter
MLAALANWIHRHARRILTAGLVLAVAAGLFGSSVISRLGPYNADDPATQSVQARARFEQAAHRQLDPSIVAIVSRRSQKTIRRVAARLRTEQDIALVRSVPRAPNVLLGYLNPVSDKESIEAAKRIEAKFAHWREVKLGGVAVANAQLQSQLSHDLEHAELLAFPFIFILSLLFFRSLVAALLPPLIGAVAAVGTFAALRLVDQFLDLSVFAVNLVTAAGLGLAIDYCLFIVSRYREEAAVTGYGPVALQRTLQTAGRTVLFSATTVAVAIAGLAIFPQRFIYSMGVGGAIVAALAAALALIVLPALLAVLGPRVNALAPRRLQLAAEHDATPDERGRWYRLSRYVMRHPRPIAIASATLMIALGIPFAGIKFTTINVTALPRSATARQVDAKLRRSPLLRSAAGPIDVVVGLPSRSKRIAKLARKLRRLPGVAGLAPIEPAGPHNALIRLTARGSPLSPGAKLLVHRVRALREPYYVGVAGQTANFVDLQASLVSHLPYLLVVVVAATVIVLFLMTGSLVLPVKAVLMNALTLSTTFGILVLIFQDGRLEGLLSFHAQQALDTSEPILLFAVAFGLATDYGVFLLARIKEAHDRNLRDRDAVATGLERTGRIVTAAALLFAVAVGSFATSQIVFVKEMALGTALAVLIDASIVRALLVPSLMALLGRVNWWAPRSLRRLHVRLQGHIEFGEAAPSAIAATKRVA